MRHTFRQLFALLLSATLCGIGIYFGQRLPLLPSLLGLPSGRELITRMPNYDVLVTVALAIVGLLLGFWIGPRIGR